MKRNLIFTLVLVVPIMLFAQKSEVFTTADGAIKGFDPVAFFKDSKPVKGQKEISLKWNEATWHFASQETKKHFLKTLKNMHHSMEAIARMVQQGGTKPQRKQTRGQLWEINCISTTIKVLKKNGQKISQAL